MSRIIDDVKRTPIPTRQKFTFVLLGLVILCSGFGLGVSLTFNHLKDRLRPKGPMPFVMDHLERVAKEYALTPEQKLQVKPIIEAFHDSFRDMWMNSQKTMSVARDQLFASMKQVLTPEQYEKWLKDREEEEKKRSRRGPFSRRGDRGGRRDRGGPPPWERDPNKKPDPNRPSRWRRGDRGQDANAAESGLAPAPDKQVE